MYDFFVLIPSAFAQDAAQQQPPFMQVLMEMMPMFCIVFFIFYFMVIKPQQRKMQDQQRLLQSLKKGEVVTTTGGIIGRVAGTEKDHILLEVSPNVRLRIENVHVLRRLEKEGETANT